MDFDTIIKDIEEKLESGTMKLEYLSYILNKNKIEDVFTFIKKIIDKSSVIDNYLFTYLHGKKQYSEEEIYKKFGDTNGDIIFCYASIKDLIVEDNLDYSYGDSTCLYSDDLFFSEIREIPIMDKSVTNNYIEKFQKYKKLYEESENFSEKTAYEKKYVFYQNQVIEGNIRLIISIANKRIHSNIELNELVNEGTFGMIKAMEKFDPTLGFAFSTYATCWIRQSINRAIEEKGRTIRIPSGQYRIYNKYIAAVKTLSIKLNREPTLEELADYLEMDLKKLTSLVISFSENTSLDAPAKDSDDKDQENMFNFLKSGEFEDKVVDDITINHLMSGLNEQEKKIIILRFIDNYTLDEVGKVFGLTRERIRQKEKKALKKMYDLSKVSKKSLLEYINIPQNEIFSLVENLDNSSKKIIHEKFGYSLNKKVVKSVFEEKEIKVILDYIIEEYRKKKMERIMPILYTLEELLNPYPKESEEYEKTNHRIKIIWDEEEKNTLINKLLVQAFGVDGKKTYNKSDFTSGENNLILNKLERWRHKLRQWPKNVDNNKTLEELLNKAYNKEERDEINKRIAYLWENQDKTTMIYAIMVKAFGINGNEKYDYEKLNSRERNLLDSKLSNWASKIQRINFWPLKKDEGKNKKTYDGKYLWELLQVTKEELSIITRSLNKTTKFYEVLERVFGKTFENIIKLDSLSESDLKILYANLPNLRKKVNEPTPFLRKTLKEILNCEIPYAIKDDYLLQKAFGPNLDEPFLNTLNVTETKRLMVLLKELKEKYKKIEVKKEPEIIISPEDALLLSIVEMMPEDVKEPFMLYFGLKDGKRYCQEDIQLELSWNLCKVTMKVKEGIAFVKNILETYEDAFDKNFVSTEEILKRLK